MSTILVIALVVITLGGMTIVMIIMERLRPAALRFGISVGRLFSATLEIRSSHTTKPRSGE
jgi:hypothetical protein